MIKILSSPYPKTEILEVSHDLIGDATLEFKKHLYDCSDRCVYHLMINFKNISVVSHEIINLIGDFKIKGLQIQLFNIGEELRWLIKKSGRLDVLKMIQYDTDIDKAIPLLKKGALRKSKGNMNRRHSPRSLNIFVPAEFYYNPYKDGIVSGQLHILNISEGGALVSRILVVYKLTGRTFSPPEINKQKFYKLRFKLDENQKEIEATAKCVRSYSVDGSLYAGIQFSNISDEDKAKINEFVSSAYDLGRL